MKFMLCLDGSRYSEAAIPICKELANAAGAKVYLVRVIEHQVPNLGEPYSGNIELPPSVERQFERTDQELNAELNETAKGFPAEVEGILLHASTAGETLIEEARRLEADLIVMATHSRNVLGKMVFGSTAEQVLRSGVAPVLMVHPVEQPGPPPLSELPLDTFVFSSDGLELGQFTARNGDELEITRRDGGKTRINQRDVAYLEAGRLVLKLPADELARKGRR